MSEQDMGASGKPDRATHEPSQQAVSAVPVGIPSASRWLPKEQSPIWGYAKAMGLALQGVVPEDMRIQFGDGLRVEGTVKTMQEAEALREIIRHLGQHLPSGRKMLAADIGVDPPKSDWRERLYKMLGDPAQAMSAETAETAKQAQGQRPASASRHPYRWSMRNGLATD